MKFRSVTSKSRAKYRSRSNSRNEAQEAKKLADIPDRDSMMFGKAHYGKQWCDIPESYLKWMTREVDDEFGDRAVLELLRRSGRVAKPDQGSKVKKKKPGVKARKKSGSRGLGSEDCSAPESSLVSFVMPNGQMTKIPAGWSVGDVEEETPF